MTRPIAGRCPTAVGLLLGALLVVLATPGAATAHADLIGSTPRSMTRVDTPPGEVVLRFSESMDPQLATVVLTVNDQQPQRVATRIGDDPGVLVAEVPAAMVDTGPWRVDYRVTSVDGHPIQGRLDFVVEDRSRATSGETKGLGSTAGQRKGAQEAGSSIAAEETANASAGEDSAVWLILLVTLVMLTPVVVILMWSMWRHRRTARAGDGGV